MRALIRRSNSRSLRLERSQVIMPTADSSAPKEVVTAALLVIGGKILSGRTKDQNIGYIAEYLTAVGIDLKEVRVVGDEESAIVDALNALRHLCTYVFTTGGIGRSSVDQHRSAHARHPARMSEDENSIRDGRAGLVDSSSFDSNSEVRLHHKFIRHQFGGSDRGDDSTFIHHIDEVSHSHCQLDVLLNQQDGETALLEAEDQLLDFLHYI